MIPTAESRIAEATRLLLQARSGQLRMARLPEHCRPENLAEAHAVQDRVAVGLGQSPRGWKANAPAGGEISRAPLLQVRLSGDTQPIPAGHGAETRVEAEIGFVLQGDLPRRAAPYAREELVGAVFACAAIEIMQPRYSDWQTASRFEMAADGLVNHAAVFGVPRRDWSSLSFNDIGLEIRLDDATVARQNGGHPNGDPLLALLGFVNAGAAFPGMSAGQVFLAGSFIRPLPMKRPMRIEVCFAGFEPARVTCP